MTDDQTQRYDLGRPDPAVENDPTMNGEMDAAPGAAAPVVSAAAATAPDAAVSPDAALSPDAAFTTPPAVATTAVPVAASGGSKGRWFVALAVAVVAIGAAIAGFMLLNAKTTPEALAYVPADAAFVFEIRPDLPGDQMEQVGKFIAHFPGFADLSTIDQKVDEAFTRLVRNAGGSGAGVDYVTDIKPWLNGPLYIAVRKADTANTSVPTPFGGLLSATTNGAVTCASVFKDQATTTETYQGTQLVSFGESACAIKDRQGLIGDIASVKAALDAKASGNGIGGSAKYRAATAALTGDHLATMYYDFGSYFDLLKDMMQTMPGASAMPFDLATMSLPAWGMIGIRAEGDAIVMDAKAPIPAPATSSPSMLPLPAAHKSEIAAMAPADAVAYIEGQGAGAGIQNMLTALRTIPEFDAQLKSIDGVVDLRTVVGWVQDAGVIVTGGDSPTASVVLLASDEAGAAEKAGSIGTVIGLLTLQAPNAVSVHDTTVNGVKVTTITITDIGALTGGTDVVSPTGPIELSYAVKGKALIFGIGTGAIDKLVNVQAGASLADDPAFKHVAARGVSPSGATVYVAIPKLLDVIESAMPADQLATWKSDIKPYLEPLEAMYFVTESEGDLAESTAILSVKPN